MMRSLLLPLQLSLASRCFVPLCTHLGAIWFSASALSAICVLRLDLSRLSVPAHPAFALSVTWPNTSARYSVVFSPVKQSGKAVR